MNDLLGFASISIVIFFTTLIALRWPGISRIIFTALICRIFLMLVGHYLIELPDSNFDAKGIENLAWQMGQNGFFNALDKFPGFNSFFYSWINGLLYSLFGRSLLMIQSINMLFNIFSIFLAWLLVKKIWNDDAATKAGWVFALFPSLILYSILPLRESFNIFFLVVATFGMSSWVKKKDLKSMVIAISGFVGAALFHGVLILGAMIFLLVVGIVSFKNFLWLIYNKRLNIKHLFVVIIASTYLMLFLFNFIKIPYLGTFEQASSMSWISSNVKFRISGDAAYSSWATLNSGADLLYKSFLRVIYFLFSPFPWDIKKTFHLIGLIDGILYMFIIFILIKNLDSILKNPPLRIILLILMCYFFIFGIGVSNFGAGIRHRSKFVIELIILISPFLPSLKLFKDKKTNNEIINHSI